MTASAFTAQVLAIWQEEWNRRWRFSRGKVGLWLLLFQLGLGLLALWRLRSAASGAGLADLTVVMAAQAAGWSALIAFLGGRQELYGRRTLALLHASAAPSLSPVAAHIAAGLPRRAWSLLVWAGALGMLAPAGLRVVAVPLFWLVGMAAAAVGGLAGLLLLVAWVRLAPRALGAVWAGLMIVMVVLVWYLIYQLVAGLEPGVLARSLAALRWQLLAAMGVGFGLPGLAMLLWLGLAPARMGDAYREGWLRLLELADGAAGARRSAWPLVVPGLAGAVQAKEWLLIARNPGTWFRLGGLALLALLLIPARPAMLRLAVEHHDLVVLGAGVGAVVFAFGEMAAAFFAGEGHRFGLAALAGASPGRLLAGKAVAGVPYGLLCGLCTWAVAFALGDGPLRQAGLAAAGLAIGLGMGVIALGCTAFDATVTEPGEELDAGALGFLLEQVPRGPGGSVGFIAAGAFGAAAVWALGAGRSGLLLAGLAALPVLALLAGRWRLTKTLDGR